MLRVNNFHNEGVWQIIVDWLSDLLTKFNGNRSSCFGRLRKQTLWQENFIYNKIYWDYIFLWLEVSDIMGYSYFESKKAFAIFQHEEYEKGSLLPKLLVITSPFSQRIYFIINCFLWFCLYYILFCVIIFTFIFGYLDQVLSRQNCTEDSSQRWSTFVIIYFNLFQLSISDS